MLPQGYASLAKVGADDTLNDSDALESSSLVSESSSFVSEQKNKRATICKRVCYGFLGCCCLSMLAILVIFLIPYLMCACSGGISSDEPYLIVNGYDKLEIPRMEIGGFVEEYLFRYKIKENGFKVNSSAVFMKGDGKSFIQGTFVHKYADGHYDFGVVKLNAGPNPVALMSPRIHFGAVEKMHVINTTRETDYTARERAEQAMRDRTAWTAYWAYKLNYLKRFLLNTYMVAGKIGTQFVRLTTTPEDVENVRKFAEDGEQVPDSWHDRVHSLRNMMEMQIEAEIQHGSNFSNPMQSYIGCIHWEKGEQQEEDGCGGIWFPLDTKLMQFRGAAISAPFKDSRVAFGTGFFRVHGEYLEYFIGGASLVPIGDVANAADPLRKQFVGSPDGDGKSSIAKPKFNAVPTSCGKQTLAFFLSWLASMVPPDYEMLTESRAANDCPPETEAALSHSVATENFLPLIHPDTAPTSLKIKFLKIATWAPDCTADWMKPDRESLVDYTMIEGILIVHALRETVGKLFAPILMPEKGTWNTLNASLV